MPNAPRTAIVTGASRGIGRAIAVALGSARFNVTINYNTNADAAHAAAEAVKAAGGDALTVQADIGSRGDRERLLAETCDRFGPATLLVNNAGVAPRVRADLLEASEEEFDHVIATNLKGPYFLSQRFARLLLERGDNAAPAGAIVNIGSISAYTASINRGEYCIAKAGIAMMTQLYAARLAEHGINVYEIRPGIVATDMTAGVQAKYDQLIFEQGLTPIRRWGQPEDIAKAVRAIAEGYLPFSTGEVINVDGGFHMHRL